MVNCARWNVLSAAALCGKRRRDLIIPQRPRRSILWTMTAGFHAGRSTGSSGGRAIRRDKAARSGPAQAIRSTLAGSEGRSDRGGGAGGGEDSPGLLPVGGNCPNRFAYCAPRTVVRHWYRNPPSIGTFLSSYQGDIFMESRQMRMLVLPRGFL